MRTATPRSTPTGSSAGSRVATYASTQSRARARHRADWAASAKPSGIQAASSSEPAAAGVRRRNGSSHQSRSALCTAAPSELCAHGGPFGGAGRTR